MNLDFVVLDVSIHFIHLQKGIGEKVGFICNSGSTKHVDYSPRLLSDKATVTTHQNKVLKRELQERHGSVECLWAATVIFIFHLPMWKSVFMLRIHSLGAFEKAEWGIFGINILYSDYPDLYPGKLRGSSIWCIWQVHINTKHILNSKFQFFFKKLTRFVFKGLKLDYSNV